MALQHKNFVTGRVANLIFYQFRGSHCSRTVPTKVKQTKATKASAKEFGKAVCYSKILRLGLNDLLPFPKDKPMMYRLNNALLQWLKDSRADKEAMADNIESLASFEFNEGSELKARLKVRPIIDFSSRSKIIIEIPVLVPHTSITVPAHTKTISWTIMAVSCNTISQQELPETYKTNIETVYNEKSIASQQIELPFTIQKGDIVLVAISLKYIAKRNGKMKPIEEKRWLPAGVVGAFYKN